MMQEKDMIVDAHYQDGPEVVEFLGLTKKGSVSLFPISEWCDDYLFWDAEDEADDHTKKEGGFGLAINTFLACYTPVKK